MTHITNQLLRKIAWSRTPLIQTRAISSIKKITSKKQFGFIPSLPTRIRPTLLTPGMPPIASFRPARYFQTEKETKFFTNCNLLTESFEAATPRSIPYNAKVLRIIRRGTGVLRKNEQGLVYLKVDDRLITELLPLFASKGMVRPPQEAHIPVISKREGDYHYLSVVKELGEDLSFSVEGLYSVTPDTWPEMEEVWFLKVGSWQLEEFRRSHFLTARPAGHSFHIVVGVKPRSLGDQAIRPQPFLRINGASFPV